MNFKTVVISVTLAVILVSTTITFHTHRSVYSQSLKDSETIKTYSNSKVSISSFTSTDSDNSKVAQIVLLSQNLSNESYGYRDW